jgi:copper transporter 1
MLWNWYTIDACFLSSSWKITSNGMFAGSCIGVILLVMFLEFLRRLGKEYDRYILRQYERVVACSPTPVCESGGPVKEGTIVVQALDSRLKFRPNVIQQAVRATLHMAQFAVAYIVMLLAMYYNGYIIICIFIGAWLGAFVFSWESVGFG